MDSIVINDKTAAKKETPKNFPASTLPPIGNFYSFQEKNTSNSEEILSSNEKYLSTLTNKQIFEKVFKNSEIIKNESAILDYLSLKKENIDDRVFGNDSKNWQWKYDFRINQYILPDFGLFTYILFLKSNYNSEERE